MALFNPVPVIVTVFLALVALPLAGLAFVTTWLAFWVLFTRLLWVYAGLAWDIARYLVWDRWQQGRYIESPAVSRRPSRHASPTRSPPMSPGPSSSPLSKGGPAPRRRTGSMSSNGSAGPRVAFSGVTLLGPSNAMERDFEGLGGWRIADGGDAAGEHDWEGLHSRFDFPSHHDRHHYRSHTHAGAFSTGSAFGAARAGAASGLQATERPTTTSSSPNSSRSRTPSRARVGSLTNLERSNSYFPLGSSAQPRKVAA